MGKNTTADRALLWTLLLASSVALAAGQTVGFPPSNCIRECSGIQVPYPFGLYDDPAGEGCISGGPGFQLTCNDSYSPPKLLSGNVEVTGINISSARMGILLNISYDCYNTTSGLAYEARTWRTNLGVYRLSSTENEFTAVGCETLAQFKIGNQSFAGCMSGCSSPDMADGKCNGFGCCRTPIPNDIQWYSTSYYNRKNESRVYEFNPCSYFFIAEKGNYTFHRSDLRSMEKNRTFPVVLDWAIGRLDNLTCEEARKNESSYVCVAANSECLDSINGPGYVCNCSEGYSGNPYLHDGCQDIDECGNRTRYPCFGLCINKPGGYDCKCEDGYYSSDPKIKECIKSSGTFTLALKLVIGIGSSVAFVFIVSLTCCLVFQKRKILRLQEECFKRNGGVALQQALQNRRSTFKIFPISELKRATNNFNDEQILGRGGYGTVYKGKVDDGRIVAIKRSMVVDEKNSNDFANELFILSEISHKNIVKLLGCCLDDEIPMLAYEFIARGTLFDLIHKGPASIPFGVRLRIATESAEALKYLHTDIEPSILHGDVKSSNILLDENYIAKVSDFGTSKLAAKDKSQFTTFIQGTYGYLDPEYMINGYLTEKSDVFSFGVILVELLTRRVPFDFGATDDRERSLALKFISCANGGRLREILDPEIVEDNGMPAGVVMNVVEIALKCLKLQGEERPTMREVAMELESANRVQTHPWTIPDDLREAEQLLGGVEGATLETRTTTTFNVEIPRGR